MNHNLPAIAALTGSLAIPPAAQNPSSGAALALDLATLPGTVQAAPSKTPPPNFFKAPLPSFANITLPPHPEGTRLSVPIPQMSARVVSLSESALPIEGQNSAWSSVAKKILLGLGTTSAIMAGYLLVGLRSVPLNKRDEHLFTRFATSVGFSKDEACYPYPTAALRITCVNNAALLISGVALALQGQQSLLPNVFFAVAFVAAGLTLQVVRQHTQKTPPVRFLQACEVLSWTAIGCFAASRVPLVADLAKAHAVNAIEVGGYCALVARLLGLVPSGHNFIQEALNPKEGEFPSLKASYIWTLGSLFSAWAADFALSSGRMLATGAFLQNLVYTAGATACFFWWRHKVRRQGSSGAP